MNSHEGAKHLNSGDLKTMAGPFVVTVEKSANPRPSGCGFLGFAVLAIALTSGCSVSFKGELLNPLNKSGREEVSRPVAPPSPTPTPTPTPEIQ